MANLTDARMTQLKPFGLVAYTPQYATPKRPTAPKASPFHLVDPTPRIQTAWTKRER